jgi:hypothetical protein
VQQWIGKKRKSKIWDCMQLAGKKISPFYASVNQIFKNDKVVYVTRAILSWKIRRYPNQAYVDNKQKGIKKGGA